MKSERGYSDEILQREDEPARNAAFHAPGDRAEDGGETGIPYREAAEGTVSGAG